MSNLHNKCTVRKRDIKLADIIETLDSQENIYKPNERKGSEDAFTKTLYGSEVYLEEQRKAN